MKSKAADFRTQTKKTLSQPKSQISPAMQVSVLKSSAQFGTLLKEPMAQLRESQKSQRSSEKIHTFGVF